MKLKSGMSSIVILVLALTMISIGQSVAFDPCIEGYWGPTYTTDAMAGPLMEPGDYILWYAGMQRPEGPCDSWTWEQYDNGQPVTLEGGKRYRIDYYRNGADFRDCRLGDEEYGIDVTPDSSGVWHQNKVGEDMAFAYVFEGPLNMTTG